MEFFGFLKLPTVVQLKDKTAAELTADDLNKVAAELNSHGFGGIVEALQSIGSTNTPAPEIATLQANLAEKETEVATLQTKLATETGKIATLTTQLQAAQAEVARLGKQPGTEPATPISSTTTEGDTDPEPVSFYCETDEVLKLAKAQMKATQI